MSNPAPQNNAAMGGMGGMMGDDDMDEELQRAIEASRQNM